MTSGLVDLKLYVAYKIGLNVAKKFFPWPFPQQETRFHDDLPEPYPCLGTALLLFAI
jgi:hypothetical protein